MHLSLELRHPLLKLRNLFLYKGRPNFGVAIDVREKFDPNKILLCFGATVHMSGPQGSIGKHSHTMAMSYVRQGKCLSIYSAQEMRNFCVAHAGAALDCEKSASAGRDHGWVLGVRITTK